MKLNKIFKNAILISFACLALSACATSKKIGKCKFILEMTQLNI